jgi:hypothetical protein
MPSGGTSTKSCLVLLALIGALCAGGAVVYLNPSLVPRAEHAAQHGAEWVSGALAHGGAASTPPAVAAATANPNTAPIILITPRPAATSLPDWTSADCAWAEQVMTWDHSLDAAEAQMHVISGFLTRPVHRVRASAPSASNAAPY